MSPTQTQGPEATQNGCWRKMPGAGKWNKALQDKPLSVRNYAHALLDTRNCAPDIRVQAYGHAANTDARNPRDPGRKKAESDGRSRRRGNGITMPIIGRFLPEIRHIPCSISKNAPPAASSWDMDMSPTQTQFPEATQGGNWRKLTVADGRLRKPKNGLYRTRI